MNKLKIGITQGDINGVGYEVILKTFSDPTIFGTLHPHNLRLSQGGGLSSQGTRTDYQFQHHQHGFGG